MCLSPSVYQRGARSFTGFGLRCNPKFSGGDIEEVPPDPIPNSEVKLLGANGTAPVTVWESRSLPDFFETESPITKVVGLFAFVGTLLAKSNAIPRGC